MSFSFPLIVESYGQHGESLILPVNICDTYKVVPTRKAHFHLLSRVSFRGNSCRPGGTMWLTITTQSLALADVKLIW